MKLNLLDIMIKDVLPKRKHLQDSVRNWQEINKLY